MILRLGPSDGFAFPEPEFFPEADLVFGLVGFGLVGCDFLLLNAFRFR